MVEGPHSVSAAREVQAPQAPQVAGDPLLTFLVNLSKRDHDGTTTSQQEPGALRQAEVQERQAQEPDQDALLQKEAPQEVAGDGTPTQTPRTPRQGLSERL